LISKDFSQRSKPIRPVLPSTGVIEKNHKQERLWEGVFYAWSTGLG